MNKPIIETGTSIGSFGALVAVGESVIQHEPVLTDVDFEAVIALGAIIILIGLLSPGKDRGLGME